MILPQMMKPAVSSAVTDVELTITPTPAWEPGITYQEIKYITLQPYAGSGVFALDIVGVDGTLGGIIFETGGSECGLYVGFRTGGEFVAAVGSFIKGTHAEVTAAAGTISGSGTLVLEIDYDLALNTLIASVWWNGTLIGTDNGEGRESAWSGTGDGTYLLDLDTPTETKSNEVVTLVAYSFASPLRYYRHQTVTSATSDKEAGLIELPTYPTIALVPGDSGPPTAPEYIKSNIVIAIDITGLDGSAGGLIFEQGASGTGCYIGFRADGSFIARAGDGGSLNSGTQVIASPGVIAGDGTLVFEADVSGISVRVWWNNVLIGSETAGPPGDWGGTNAMSYLTTSTGVPSGEKGSPVLYTTSQLRMYYQSLVGI